VGALAEAREQGRADALAEMSAAIEQHRRATDDLDAATRALTASLDQIGRTDLDRIHEVERHVLGLAVELAQAIIGREIELDDALVIPAVERALDLVPDRGAVVLRVNPADVATVRDAIDGNVDGAHALGGHLASPVQVVADPAVARAGAVAEVGPLRVDAQVGAALARIRDAFTS
jgi:flagellar assembly protein FliH